MYTENTFTKIINRTMSATTIMETEYTLVIADRDPQALTHILIIPKRNYTDWLDFCQHASAAEQLDFMKTCATVITQGNLTNYYLQTNAGSYQEIPHMHVHLLSNDA